MKRLFPIIALCGLLFASCSTQRSAEPRRFQTLHQKANVTLQFDQRQYSMAATVQVWRNDLIILSLQPMLGIEMVRAEATKDSVLLIDKMNQRYTVLHYDMFQKLVTPAPSYRLIQDFVTAPQKPNIKTKTEQSFEMGNHKIAIACSFTQREYNTLKSPKRLDLKKYKQVSLREILPL